MNRRRFLTGKEVQAMMQAARHGQTGERDYCLILLAFRHGMRISELLDLHYRDLDLVEGRINIRRLKNGFSTVHPLMIDECDAIRCWSQLRAAWKGAQNRCAVYIATRYPAFPSTSLPNYPNRRHRRRDGNAYSPAYAAPCLRLRAGGERSGYPPYPDYLGHRNIRHTVRYTASNAARFAGLWERHNLMELNLQNQKVENKNLINKGK